MHRRNPTGRQRSRRLVNGVQRRLGVPRWWWRITVSESRVGGAHPRNTRTHSPRDLRPSSLDRIVGSQSHINELPLSALVQVTSRYRHKLPLWNVRCGRIVAQNRSRGRGPGTARKRYSPLGLGLGGVIIRLGIRPVSNVPKVIFVCTTGSVSAVRGQNAPLVILFSGQVRYPEQCSNAPLVILAGRQGSVSGQWRTSRAPN